MRFLLAALLFASGAAGACDALIITGLAKHADRQHNYNEVTQGLGCEWRWTSWRTNVVAFENSNHDFSVLYGAAYLPAHLWRLRGGIALGRASGYSTPWQKAGGFVLEYTGDEHAFDANLIPRVYGMKGVVLWLRWKPLLKGEPLK